MLQSILLRVRFDEAASKLVKMLPTSLAIVTGHLIVLQWVI